MGAPNPKSRDMSRKQFENALRRHGFETEGFLGYWRKDGVCISELNWSTRRAALAGILNGFTKLQAERRRVAK